MTAEELLSKSDFSKAANLPGSYLSHAITITSATGVGSSSTLRALKQILEEKGDKEWKFETGGGMMRNFAASLNMTIDEFSAHNLAHPEEGWDKRCDSELSRRGMENFTIIESRLSHAFVPHSFHVLLVCPLEIRATRRLGDLRKENPFITLEEVMDLIAKRDEHDNKRYERLYPGCLWPHDDFDFQVDTNVHDPQTVAGMILTAHARWCKSHKSNLVDRLA